MSNMDIVHAWKNDDYLLSLSPSERLCLPENPAGSIELRGGGKKETAISIFPRTSACCSVVIECSASNCGI